MKVRQAQRGDLDALVALLSDDVLGAQREDATLPATEPYQQAFAAIDADPNQFLAVAEMQNVLLGCMQITLIPGLSRRGMWRGQIESVRIHASERGQGLGRALFEWAIEFCQQKGCGLIQLTTDKARSDALRFYTDLGFEPSHEGLKLSL